jgi:predicted RNA-binding Zn-ribbon protein involved in translation (DUF1610 family)
LIADSFLLIRDFVKIHLNKDPLSLFGSSTWEILLSVAEVYTKERKECLIHIESIDWKYPALKDSIIDFRCDKCGSGLIGIECHSTDRWLTNFNCRSCGNSWDFEKIVELSIQEHFWTENYLSVKDGGNPSIIICPECGLNTYILEENVCVVCEESVERECQRCNMSIPIEEIDGSGYCGYCSHMMQKDN